MLRRSGRSLGSVQLVSRLWRPHWSSGIKISTQRRRQNKSILDKRSSCCRTQEDRGGEEKWQFSLFPLSLDDRTERPNETRLLVKKTLKTTTASHGFKGGKSPSISPLIDREIGGALLLLPRANRTMGCTGSGFAASGKERETSEQRPVSPPFQVEQRNVLTDGDNLSKLQRQCLYSTRT